MAMQMQLCFDTRNAARAAIRPHKNRLQAAVLEFMRKQGADGATDEEGAAALGMQGNTWRPRRLELEESGQVKRTTHKRPTLSGRGAVVFVAAEFFKE